MRLMACCACCFPIRFIVFKYGFFPNGARVCLTLSFLAFSYFFFFFRTQFPCLQLSPSFPNETKRLPGMLWRRIVSYFERGRCPGKERERTNRSGTTREQVCCYFFSSSILIDRKTPTIKKKWAFSIDNFRILVDSL